jgi:hypothetical protein
MLVARDRLACVVNATGAYPRRLEELMSPRLSRYCGHPNERLTRLFQHGRLHGAGLEFLDHDWTYRPARTRDLGYTLSATDTRRGLRYASYWLDASGVLRSARGGAAGPLSDVDSP